MKGGKRVKSSFMEQPPLKKIGGNSRVATTTVAASATDNTVVAGAFVVFVVCVVSCTAFTPDFADFADDVVAVVAIVDGTIVVVVAIVVADDVDPTVCVCVGGGDYPPFFLGNNIKKLVVILKQWHKLTKKE